MTKKELSSLEEQIKAAVELTVELFNKIKVDVHYASPHLRLGTYLNAVMLHATNDTLKVQTVAALYGSLVRDDEGRLRVACASFGNQTRNMNLDLCRELFDFWKGAYCQGEWGDTRGMAGAQSNPGIPEIDTPKYFTAGEDIQEGDPVEMVNGKVQIHADMKI